MKRVSASLRMIAATTAALVSALGCQFSSQSDSTPKNVCSVDTDCADGSTCLDGMCVGKNGSTLDLSLEITPARMPDGSPPVPIGFGPFALRGSSHRKIELPSPSVTPGYVHEGDKHLAAKLHFTPVQDGGFPLSATQLVVTKEAPANLKTTDPDFSVQLLAGVKYHMTVEPTDTTRPPYALDFTAEKDMTVDIDYANLILTSQRFYVQDVPDGQNLVLRAIDAMTGEAISSSAHVTSRPAVLVFAPNASADYRLEITAEQSYASPGQHDSACDLTTPVFPVLRIAKSALKDDETGTYVFVMPKIPVPVNYSGVVQLCPGNKVSTSGDMPMALDARTLHWNGDDNVEASYNATTTAVLDQASGELHFCTQVLPGDYVVVITPPPNLGCELFAEHQRIDSADGAPVTGIQFALRAAPVVNGTIETPEQMPVNAASVEAHALGRDFMLGNGDPSVTSYNRSAQATSDADGKFRLPVDIGSYDIVLKPAPESNYAWQVLHDVEIASRDQAFSTHITLEAPFVINGTLSYATADKMTQQSLAGAQVQAFVRVESGGVSRSIEVARTVADQAGQVTLLVAPKSRSGL